MIRQEKEQIVGELTEKFKSNPSFVITDASGLSVSQTNQFRALCFKKGIEYKVYKNSLIEKALLSVDEGYAEFCGGVLKGFSGVLFTEESPKPGAQIIKEFRKIVKDKPVLKGASIDMAFYVGNDTLEALSNLKSKNELIGDVIALLQSPAKNVISGLKSAGGKLAGIVQTLAEREEK